MNVSTQLGAGVIRQQFGARLRPLAPRPQPRGVVTCLTRSASIPGMLITEELCRALHEETGEAVLLVHLMRPPSPASTDATAIWRQGVDALCRDLEGTGLALRSVTIPTPGLRHEGFDVPSFLRRCQAAFRHVIVHASAELPLESLVDCLGLSHRALLLVPARADELQASASWRRQVTAGLASSPLRWTTLACLPPHADATASLRPCDGEIDGTLRDCPDPSATCSSWLSKQFQAGIRRLARDLGDRMIGLALSSGGARGLAHVGVIQVLEENGVEIDVVAGCSMGSYVGAVWAYGYTGAQMESLAREVENRWGLFELIDPFLLPRQGFLRGEKVKQRLKRSIGDTHFCELQRQLRIVATHLATLSRVTFASGEVARAVHASSAIPGACVPVELDGELYIDGGVADPLPVDVLEEMGVQRIIAVNTIPTSEYLRSRLEQEKERQSRLGRRGLSWNQLLNKYVNYFAPGNILDIIQRSFTGAQMQVAERSCLAADVVLRPLSFDGRWHDFRRPGKYIAIGRREAEQYLPAIKALVARKEQPSESAIAYR